MATPGILKQREEMFGESMETLIPRLLAEQKNSVFKVAMALDVFPNTVRNWLMTNDYTFDHELNRWVKVEGSTTESNSAA